jgi:hypothetical protein
MSQEWVGWLFGFHKSLANARAEPADIYKMMRTKN